jgi:hypothetical protein
MSGMMKQRKFNRSMVGSELHLPLEFVRTCKVEFPEQWAPQMQVHPEHYDRLRVKVESVGTKYVYFLLLEGRQGGCRVIVNAAYMDRIPALV